MLQPVRQQKITSQYYPTHYHVFSIFPLDNKHKNLLSCGSFTESRLLELTLGNEPKLRLIA